MEGSGLEELWQCVYAKNAVPKMVSGHSYARALRGHLLAQTALVHLLFDETEAELDDATRQEASAFAGQLQANEVTLEDAARHPTVSLVREKLQATIARLSQSRTARFWLNYVEMVQIMRLFLRAERCGDWFLTLQCTKKMLPYFFAAGHLNYFKACNAYLQQMQAAEKAMPFDEFRCFAGGSFTIRSENKFWAGVWTDMIIEQRLMRFLKGNEGITRGRGNSDKIIARLVQALLVTSKFIAATEVFTGARIMASEQHVELRLKRQQCDREHLEKFVCWLSQHNPFADRPADKLVSVSTGIIGDSHTNCDLAFEVGMSELQKCEGTPFSKLTLRHSAKVRTFSAVGITSKANAPALRVKPDQLFHRILCRINA
ncbi:Fructose-1,6-bisphosphatase class 1 2 [Frankliniella fusca]|uniref:Fructose-1,6-bisphosphatase class 1 2 n=1 Tax=Frankliniella fusca TaxID=407009 RepID=A0AAE1HI32_9NEOP|nr:Fructose-1,6-bisphosphatase class 1 2 [Frankliniella fusca]